MAVIRNPGHCKKQAHVVSEAERSEAETNIMGRLTNPVNRWGGSPRGEGRSPGERNEMKMMISCAVYKLK